MTGQRITLSAGLLLAALPAAASGGGGDQGSLLLQPQIGTVIWTVLTFVIMLVILRMYAWKPLLGALDARQKTIQDDLDQARNDRAEADAALQEHRKLITEAQRERAGALEEGRQDAERLKQEMLDEARRQRDHLLQQTELQVQAGMRQARIELRGDAADLAIRAAERLLNRSLDEAGHRQLVEDYLAELERSAGESGALPS